jgi:hypothetical protein
MARTAAGPFSTYEAAAMWINGRDPEQVGKEARASAAALRAALLSDQALADALIVAANVGEVNAARSRLANLLQQHGIRFEPAASGVRGRPVPDHPREADIAFEYYWRLRQRRRLPNTVAAVAKVYGVTADHVRKVRKEYAAVADYDRHLLKGLRAQAVARRTKPPNLPPRRQSPKSEQARQWLSTLLGHSPTLSSQAIYRRAAVAGFSRRTIERAKASLGIISARGGRTSSWKLPAPETAKSRI